MVVSMLNVHHNMNKSGVPDRSIGQIRGSRSCHPDLHQPRNDFFCLLLAVKGPNEIGDVGASCKRMSTT